jgi:hypothetical protein
MPHQNSASSGGGAGGISPQHPAANNHPSAMMYHHPPSMQLSHGQQQQQHPGYYPYDGAGFVTPTAVHQKPWVTTGSKTGVHRLPRLSLAKSSDSSDNKSTGTDDVATLATENTGGSLDEAEKLEATASALLMVSAGFHSRDKPSADNKEPSSSTPNPQSTVPLKKRKQHADLTTQEQAQQPEACQVSPASHGSINGRAVSREEQTPERAGRASAHRAPSYDSSKEEESSPLQRSSKDATQELLDSSKVHDANDIAPPAQVVFPHFPTVLHRLLSDEEFSGTVVTWLEDGEAWKVLRWDALRRNVLPIYFPDLVDEEGKPSGTIDAFLWQLSAWGFQEITDGSDVGAYKHEVRDDQYEKMHLRN